jgi:hypothetical protein
MSEGRAPGALDRIGSGTARLVRAWKVLPHESRLAAFASGALFLTLFLPWYQVTLIAPAKAAKLQSASATITGWGAFSFVEAAVLLVAAGVLTLLFQRAEGRAFHLPGGDGGVITAAGLWTCVLIVWRIFDKQGASTSGPSATTSGIEWGIFIALGAAAFLAYSGSRIRTAHRPEPPLPGVAGAPVGSNAAATTEVIATERTRRRDTRSAASVASRDQRRRDFRSPAAPDPRDQRRRGHPARPVAADWRTARSTDASADATPGHPRRRMSADEMFERVVPEDPPAVPFGRIPRAEGPRITQARPPAARPEEPRITQATPPAARPEDPTITREPPSASPAVQADDTEFAIPLEGDDTVPLGGDDTLPLGGDETPALGGDDTHPLGLDDTLSQGGDTTLPLGGDDTHPLGLDDTLSQGGDTTLPLGGDDTHPLGLDDTLSQGGDTTLPLGGDPTHPPGGDDTRPLRLDALSRGSDTTLPMGEDDTLPFDPRHKSR